MKKLTAENFDASFGESAAPILWGAKAIGRKIGRGEGWVRKVLAHMDGSPVQKTAGGALFAAEDRLIAFFRDYEPQKAA